MPAADAGPPALDPDEVHVWIVPSGGDDRMAAALSPLLSPYERQRAARMHDPRGFVIGRAGVRAILAHYARQPAGQIEIRAGAGSRPVIAGAPEWLDFSFSRCDTFHVCAVTVARRVGVDVDDGAIREDAGAVLSAYCTAEERAALDPLDGAARARALAAVRTKKDALAKAVGARLHLPLNQFGAPPGHGGLVRGAFDGAAEWWIQAFAPAEGVTGAVAGEGRWMLRQMTWPGLPGLGSVSR